jgi:hypothetical protein
MFENKCFITGGGHIELPDYFKTSILCSINPTGEWDIQIKQVQDMVIGKAEHSLISIPDGCFLSVGGSTPKSLLNNCDMYSIVKDVWIPLNPLCVPRKQTSLCVFNASAVYAFGGKTAKDLPIDSIERLNLGSPKNTWRTLMLASGCSFPPLSSSFVAQIDPFTILIAGGTTYEIGSELEKPGGKKVVPLIDCKKSMLLSTKTWQISQGPDLTYPSSFGLGPPLIGKEFVGAIDVQMSVHILETAKQSWVTIREAKWNPFKYSIKAGSEMATFIH